MRHEGIVEKAWGYEDIWVTNDKYCSKFLVFDAGGKFSMHFHANKTETWIVMSGKFQIRKINTTNADLSVFDVSRGDIIHNDVLEPHQVLCIESGTILEVSTPDSVEDNYRIIPGDSQNG
jgi:mannose-6-phosphate isomerase-like protein (cupin superfamily)